ncbi:unnamed protein product [Fusarium graminearum]|uniref:Uncharacterized protein n=1 Tax=Gibberella zeae TaxID=5518 RepID=A0A9N8NKX4_GIBZA|nr:unnamed protein product [Fusarium graminearum]
MSRLSFFGSGLAVLLLTNGLANKGVINRQIGARNLVDMKTHLAFLAKGSVTKQRLRRLLAPSSSEGTNSYLQKWYPLFYAHKIAVYLPNQAMEDTADTLPKLLKFQKLVSVSPLTAGEIQISCGAYGKKMIDRSFVWVAKSGGTSQPSEKPICMTLLKTIDLDGVLVRVLSFFTSLLLLVVTIINKAVKRSEQ